MNTTDSQPPLWALRLLRWFCKPYYVEIIEGDLWEIYDREVSDHPKRARRSFAWNTIRFFRWRYIKTLDDFYPKSSIGMYKNYFKISWRNMTRNKVYTGINIAGLTVGVACCLLILIHISGEFSYDKHYDDSERIYYVANGESGAWTAARMVSAMTEDFPEVAVGTRIVDIGPFVGEINKQMISVDGGLMTDSTFFDVFPNEFLAGDPNTALNSPNSMVLTESLVKNYFGNDNPMGRILRFEDEDFTVTGIVKDPVKTTSVPYTYLIDLPRMYEVTTGNWTGNMFYSYVKLNPNSSSDAVEAKFIDFVKRHFKTDVEGGGGSVDDYIDNRLAKNERIFSLIPLEKIHLYYAHLSVGDGGKLSNVIVISFIGLLILLVACINYINMATARAGVRMKEVGMRKVMGSNKGQLVNQFFVESTVLSGISIILGLILALVTVPYFGQLVQRSHEYVDVVAPASILFLFGLFVLIALLSGAYPALYIARMPLVSALRGGVSGSANLSMRKILVVFQFAVSIFLIASTLIIFRQVSLMQSSDPGVNTQQTYAIKHITTLGERFDPFVNQLRAQSGVVGVTESSILPAFSYISNWNYKTVGTDARTFAPDHIFADEHFLDVLDVRMIEGRYFREESAADSLNVVVSKKFAEQIGGDVIGMTLTRGPQRNFTIIGVYEDFHAKSLRKEVRPTIIRKATDTFHGSYLLVKMEGNMIEQARQIQKTWESMKDDYPFEGVFLSDSFAKLYEEEVRFGRMFVVFASLAVFIASLGLLSLAAYVIEKRFKEIAVRKVLGASTVSITTLINKDFGILVLVSSVIALPGAFYYGSEWLNSFTERIEIAWYLLAIPVVLVLMFTLLMISIQSIRVATSNPVDALRQE